MTSSAVTPVHYDEEDDMDVVSSNYTDTDDSGQTISERYFQETEEDSSAPAVSTEDNMSTDEDETYLPSDATDDNDTVAVDLESQCVFDIDSLDNVATSPGFHVVASFCQSNKTLAIFFMCVARAKRKLPTVVVVAEASCNTKSVCGKLQNFQSQYPGDDVPCFKFMDGSQEKWSDFDKCIGKDGCIIRDSKERLKMAAAMYQIHQIKEGGLILVVQSHCGVLYKTRKFIKSLQIAGVMVIVDEGDRVLLNRGEGIKKPKKKKRDEGDAPAQYHRELRMLLSSGSSTGVPLSTGSSCDTMAIVSATHLATMHWLEMEVHPEVEMQSHLPNMDKVKLNGYATGEQLELSVELPEKFTAKERHGWDSQQTVQALAQFRADYLAVEKKGAMFVAVLGSPMKSNKRSPTSMNIMYAADAVSVLKCPEAISLVFTCEGIRVTTRILQSAFGKEDCKEGFFDPSSYSEENVVMMLKWDDDSEVVWPPKLPKRRQVDLSDFLATVDGLDDGKMKVPIMLFAYELFHRSRSVRSNRRVPTHMLVNMAKQKLTCDVMQTLFRHAGYQTDDIRRNNGFEHVRTYMHKDDFECSVALTGFLFELLKPFQNGFRSIKGWEVKGEKFAYYTKRYVPVIVSGRQHTSAEGGSRKRKLFVRNDALYYEGQGPTKNKKLKSLVAKDTTGEIASSLEVMVTATISKCVPLVIQLDAIDLKQRFREEVARGGRDTGKLKTFTAACPITRDACVMALNQSGHVLPPVDKVVDMVLCEDNREMLQIKAAVQKRRAIRPILPRDMLFDKEWRSIRSVYVDVTTWKCYVMDGTLTPVSREAVVASEGEYMVKIDQHIQTLLSARDKTLKVKHDELMHVLETSAYAQNFILRVVLKRWKVATITVDDSSVKLNDGSDGKIVIRYASGDDSVFLSFCKLPSNTEVVRKIVTEAIMNGGAGEEWQASKFNNIFTHNAEWVMERTCIMHARSIKRCGQGVARTEIADGRALKSMKDCLLWLGDTERPQKWRLLPCTRQQDV